MAEKFIAYFNTYYADFPPFDIFGMGLSLILAINLVDLLLRAVADLFFDSWSSIYRKIKSRKSSSSED